MKANGRSSVWLIAILSLLFETASWAQKPAVDAFQARIVTRDGNRFRGVLEAVDDSYLYLSHERSFWRSDDGSIALADIRKVVIRRDNKKTVLLTGTIIGALVAGFLSNESLQRNQPRSPIAYGFTLTAAAAGGAAAGLVLSSAIGNVASRVIRPIPPDSPERSLQRQLEPFSVRYQQDLLNRLPRQ